MPAHREELKISGANLWYLVGLITSDGCLSSDGRHIDITSKDREFLLKIKTTLNITNKIGEKFNALKQKNFHIQIGNRNFYDFLLSVGLTPNKSLTLKELNIPEAYFPDFLRGLIDGDGCIRNWIHPGNKREQWSLRVYSVSIKFLEWLGQAIEEILKARGKIHKQNKQGTCCELKFGKMAARQIAQQCYYPGSFGLERKNLLAEECINSYAGWRKSRTIDLLNSTNVYQRAGVGMADNGDLKSPVRKSVRVRLPPCP